MAFVCAGRAVRFTSHVRRPAAQCRRARVTVRAALDAEGGGSGGKGGDSVATEQSADVERERKASIEAGVDEYKSDNRGETSKFHTVRSLGVGSEPLLRVLIVGCSEKEREFARALKKSEAVSGVYYVGDTDDFCDIEMSKLVTHVPVNAADVEGWIGFCKWARVDVVFVGATRTLEDADAVKSALAELNVTLYASDVTESVLVGDFSVDECLRQPLAAAEEELPYLIERLQGRTAT